jgi:hypothetical protein
LMMKTFDGDDGRLLRPVRFFVGNFLSNREIRRFCERQEGRPKTSPVRREAGLQVL